VHQLDTLDRPFLHVLKQESTELPELKLQGIQYAKS
jgi:hypothetical protein